MLDLRLSETEKHGQPGGSGVARLHAGRPLWALFFLAPAAAELLSGSTPPAHFLNPFVLLFEAALYGSGAILARELVRRRGLGWTGLLLLGAAYGVLEEGLVVTSWFNPYWPDVRSLGSYGRMLETNWVWALGLTAFHAVWSITIPVALVETLFPAAANRPWLGRKSVWTFGVLLALASALGLLGFGFLAYRKQGYTHPPLAWLLAALLAAGLVWLALRLRPAARPPAHTTQLPPGLWRLRLAAFGWACAFFFSLWAVHGIVAWAPMTLLIMAGVYIFGAHRLRRWSAHAPWGAGQRLALTTGAQGFFLVLAPLSEFVIHPGGKPEFGLTLVALLWTAGLVWLARRVNRRSIGEAPI